MSFDDEPRVKPALFASRSSFCVKCPHCSELHTHGTCYDKLGTGLSYAGPRHADCFKGEYVVEKHPGLPTGKELKALLALFFSENQGRYPVRDLIEFYKHRDVSDEVVLL